MVKPALLNTCIRVYTVKSLEGEIKRLFLYDQPIKQHAPLCQNYSYLVI